MTMDEITRVCRTCLLVKSVAEFPSKGNVAKASTKSCRQCYKSQRLYFAWQSYDRNSKTPEYRARRRVYLRANRKSPQALARESRHSARYAERYPEKKLTARIVRNALERGEIIRPSTCPICGEAARLGRDGRSLIHAHHDNYNKPLGIRWMCVMCHSLEHRRVLPEKGK